PFLFAAILAYTCIPLVDWLQEKKLPRSLAVSVVLAMLLIALVALALVPVVESQLASLLNHVPDYLDWLRTRLLPWLGATFGVDTRIELTQIKRALADALSLEHGAMQRWLPKITTGGLALVGFFTALVLLPVVLFYFLRDWHAMVGRIDQLIPRRHHGTVAQITGEIDRVLGEFLRGQLSVIVLMSLFYVAALWLAGLEFALPIGILSGVLVFVPYLGATVGLLLGTLSGLVQFDGVLGLIPVWIAFAIGQMLEGMVITPWLVGNRIGLHPVAVIFALLALPASAALLVALRHLRARYVASDLYKS
ncbi:MAG: AI-2E family transporter, partial [Burkholderiales bacterium]